MATLSRKERERAVHRRLVLEAAEAVFAEKGYHEAAVQEIAERAEFSVGSIYNMFQSKSGIYAELIETRVAEFERDVAERLARCEDVREKVREAIAAKMDFFKQHQPFFLIFSPVRGYGHSEQLEAFRELSRRYRRHLGRLADIFAQGIREGVFVAVQPMVLALVMEGLTNSAIAYWVHSGGSEDALAEPEVLQKVFLEGALAKGER